MYNAMELSELFRRHFEVSVANTPKLRSEIFKLRYRVYCEEQRIPGFLESDYPDEMEYDDYDPHSLHGIIRHRATGDLSGTVRLILRDDDDTRYRLPVETHCGLALTDVTDKFDPGTVAEISRFVLSRRFRCRYGESSWPDGVPEEIIPREGLVKDNRRSAPHPILGLLKAIGMMSWQHGLRYWCAGMEPRLHRRLKQFGVELPLVKTDVEYHGNVNVYCGNIGVILNDCFRQRPEIWHFLTDSGAMWPLDSEYGRRRSVA